MAMPPGYRRLSPGMYRAPDGALMERQDGGKFAVSARSGIQPGKPGVPPVSPPVRVGPPQRVSPPKPFYQKPMLPPPQGGFSSLQGFPVNDGNLHSSAGRMGSAARADYPPQFVPRGFSQMGFPSQGFQQQGFPVMGSAAQYQPEGEIQAQGQPQNQYLQNYSDLANVLRSSKPVY